MLKSRFATVASFATVAALAALLVPAAAPAKDLQSKLESKEATLSKVREKKGVLTSTITHYGDQIDRLTTEVAALRNQEAGVRARLAAKQGELDHAVAQLDVAKKRLAQMRAHLKRALVALRERLVAIYETGSPDVLNVILAQHTGQPIERISKDTDRDFYMTAEQAKEYGIVDDILTKQLAEVDEDAK